MLTSSDPFMPACGDRSRGQFCDVIPATAGIQYSTASPGLPDRQLSRAMTRLFDSVRTKVALAVALACSAFVLQPAAAQAGQDEYPHCISHLWATGSHFGGAEAIARRDAQSEDARMLEHIHAAGVHVEHANALCAQRPSPWPAWPNWREIQDQLTEMADKFHDGVINRAQLTIALAGIYQSLAAELDVAHRIPGAHVERDATCEELYMRSGVALGFAQTTTQISGRLTPDAAVRLRQALSLVYQMREMPQPCRDFQGLIPAIGEALNGPNDPSIVARVDDIWHAGEAAAGPSSQ